MAAARTTALVPGDPARTRRRGAVRRARRTADVLWVSAAASIVIASVLSFAAAAGSTLPMP